MPEAVTFVTGTKPGKIITSARHVAFEIECERQKNWTDAMIRPYFKNEVVDIRTDGSLYCGGLELVTSPASLNELERVATNYTKTLRTLDFYVSKRCGLHTHVDCRDFQENGVLISRLFKTVWAIEPVIFALIAQSRNNNTFCKPIRNRYSFGEVPETDAITDFVASLYKVNKEYVTPSRWEMWKTSRAPSYFSRYFGLNLQSIFCRGSAEFRYHQGSLDPEKMLHWAAFLQAVIEYAVNQYDEIDMKRISFLEPKKALFELVHILPLQPAVAEWLIKRFDYFALLRAGKVAKNAVATSDGDGYQAMVSDSSNEADLYPGGFGNSAVNQVGQSLSQQTLNEMYQDLTNRINV